jgi:hypothetical protein
MSPADLGGFGWWYAEFAPLFFYTVLGQLFCLLVRLGERPAVSVTEDYRSR